MATSIISLRDDRKLYICSTPTSMIYGIPGLLKKVQGEASYKHYARDVYVFISRDFSKVKVLWWDGNGYAMFYKHVPRNTFRIEWRGGYKAITGVNLKELLETKNEGRQR